jgi:O-antigen/teichoic acid export membrane protein
MSVANRVMKNTGILYARMAITIFISLYSTRLILNALGVADFGVFNLIAGAIAMLTFLNAAMASATQRFMSFAQGAKDFEKVKTIFNVSIILHIIIGFLILLIFEGVGYFLFKGVLKIPAESVNVAKLLYQFMIVSTLFTIISVPYDAVINAHENMLLFSVLGVLEALLKLAIALYISYISNNRLVTYGVLIATSSILLLLIRRIYCHRTYDECEIKLFKYSSKAVFKEMAGFAGWSFLGSSSGMVANYGQGILMNMFFGTVVNAAQGVSGQVSGQLSAFAVTMLKALNPILAKSEGAGDRALLIKASLTGAKISFFLLVLFYIPILVEMPFVFNLWLKNVPQYAVIFCRLLLTRNIIEQLFVTLSSTIAATGNIRTFQIYNSILTLFPLLITFILFKFSFPPYTLYIVYISYTILTSILIVYFSKKSFDLPVMLFLKDTVMRCLISFFIVLGIAILLNHFLNPSVLRFVLIALASTSTLLITFYFVGFSGEERNNFKLIIRPLIQRVRHYHFF